MRLLECDNLVDAYDVPVHIFIGGAPFIMFDLTDPRFRSVIRRQDPNLFKLLDYMLDGTEEIRRMSEALRLLDFGWRYVKQGSPELLAQYEEDLRTFQRCGFGGEVIRAKVTQELANLEKHRVKRKRKDIETAAKQQLTQVRRTQFAAKREELMLALIERDGYQCARCGSQDNLTIDHIVPLSKGGSDDLDNLQLLCKTHNSSKGDRLPEED
jgi:5-methylcytosine-specific restriction endonuclease McrA